ncbi:hypothetical protein PIB30_034270 [Stylosanthes scabra]|uniref:FAR1 domain-containing protein n=1 Tax=Stylosanthes scabra TaxID=79078 RepID=A0ABU6XAB8_9FABA|nr:hypothetical protein [Stylosanthes scabra]
MIWFDGSFDVSAEFEEQEVTPNFLCDVDEEYIHKVGMTFLTYEEANDFYKEYVKRGGFVT